MNNINLGIKTDTTEAQIAYNNAVKQYFDMFGYEPNFECLPDPDIDMILNAVKTGVELYEKESSDTSVLL